MPTTTQTIQVHGQRKTYVFDGPFTSTAPIQDVAGVYVIIAERSSGFYVIDVGESGQLRTRLDNHDRKSCWSRNLNSGLLRFAVLYTPGVQQQGRCEIEFDIRAKNNPPCGER